MKQEGRSYFTGYGIVSEAPVKAMTYRADFTINGLAQDLPLIIEKRDGFWTSSTGTKWYFHRTEKQCECSHGAYLAALIVLVSLIVVMMACSLQKRRK